MSLDPKVRQVMQRINRKQGAGTVILGSQIQQPMRETITSGSLSFDAALGGGWATNHWVEILGFESSGKTMVVLKTIAANQRLDPNWTTVWFASEDFSEPYAEMLGVDLDRVIVEEENEMETVYQHAIDFLETKGIDCLVIDSLPALVPIREDDNTMEDFQPGLGAFLTGKFFRKSNPSIKRSMTIEERPVTGFIINQWRETFVRMGDPRTTPGGKAKNFFFYQRVDLRRDKWISNSRDAPIGQVIKLSNLKNKYAPPRRTGTVDAYFARGNGFKAGSYDVVKDIVSAAITAGVVERSGSRTYSFGEEKFDGKPRLESAVRADKSLRSELRSAVRAAASAPMPPAEETPRKVSVKKTVPKKRAVRER
jgi:recombination protein RecA